MCVDENHANAAISFDLQHWRFLPSAAPSPEGKSATLAENRTRPATRRVSARSICATVEHKRGAAPPQVPCVIYKGALYHRRTRRTAVGEGGVPTALTVALGGFNLEASRMLDPCSQKCPALPATHGRHRSRCARRQGRGGAHLTREPSCASPGGSLRRRTPGSIGAVDPQTVPLYQKASVPCRCCAVLMHAATPRQNLPAIPAPFGARGPCVPYGPIGAFRCSRSSGRPQ